MKLVFDFPRKDVEPNLKDINEFLNKVDLINKPFRRFGVYFEDVTDKSKQKSGKGEAAKKYILIFKFFETRKKDKADCKIEIEQGWFDFDVPAEKAAFEKFKRDVYFLSYIAALSLQSVKFSTDEEFLNVTVELDDCYQKLINTHRKLIFPKQ